MYPLLTQGPRRDALGVEAAYDFFLHTFGLPLLF
jgi:hypothetical protein